MSDEIALLRAIVESPDDLALRMVYADWCEEHGRPARAALIRGQCFLDPLVSERVRNDDEPDPRWIDLTALPERLREDVLEPFRPFIEARKSAGSGYFSIRRGFVESVVFRDMRDLVEWFPHARYTFARTPLLTLSLWRRNYRASDQLPPAALRALLAVNGIERLRILDMSHFVLTPTGARVLLESGGQLRLLVIRLCHRTLTNRVQLALRERFGEALRFHRRDPDDAIPF